jgi:hypothetical protein
VDALRAHRDGNMWNRQKLGADYADGDLVFTTGLGAPLDPGNVTRACRRALKAAALPAATRFHHLRHGAATMMLGAGEVVTTVSQSLGHSSPAVTMTIYAHVVPGATRRAAERLAATIKQARTTWRDPGSLTWHQNAPPDHLGRGVSNLAKPGDPGVTRTPDTQFRNSQKAVRSRVVVAPHGTVVMRQP